MRANTFLLYGANGYTGALIARYASLYGLQPILAGRNEAAVSAIARRENLPFIILNLDDAAALEAALKKVSVVVHAAGPYTFTAMQMVTACMKTGTHYLDLNGDLTLFQQLYGLHTQAKESGIMLMPGVGFDVVPTDCLALVLKEAMPDAMSLKLAFATTGGISQGTAKSIVDKLGELGLTRKENKLLREPIGQRSMWVDFGSEKQFVMSVPMGDLLTAAITTGIPTIETYASISPHAYRLLKLQPFFNPILRLGFVRKGLQRIINFRSAGPSDMKRNSSKSMIWGEVRNTSGDMLTATLTGPEAYTITVHSTLLIVKRVLDGRFGLGTKRLPACMATRWFRKLKV
jgi:short subunit dehydrogenase-like uncharacterized protein